MSQTKKFRGRINRRKTRSKTFNKKKSTIKKTSEKYNKTKKRLNRRGGMQRRQGRQRRRGYGTFAPGAARPVPTAAPSVCDNNKKNEDCGGARCRPCILDTKTKLGPSGLDNKSCHFNEKVFFKFSDKKPVTQSVPLKQSGLVAHGSMVSGQVYKTKNDALKKEGIAYGPKFLDMRKAHDFYKKYEKLLAPAGACTNTTMSTVDDPSFCEYGRNNELFPDGREWPNETICSIANRLSQLRQNFLNDYYNDECKDCDYNCKNHRGTIEALNRKILNKCGSPSSRPPPFKTDKDLDVETWRQVNDSLASHFLDDPEFQRSVAAAEAVQDENKGFTRVSRRRRN